MKRLLIHIGGPKTGSTALQQALAEHYDHFLDQGLNYPAISGYGHRWQDKRGLGAGNGEPIRLGHVGLSVACEQVLQDTRADDVALVSSENLAPLAATEAFWRELANLKTTRELDLRVIYYVRNPMGLLLSSFNLDVKFRGFSGTLSEYVLHCEYERASLVQFHITPDVLRLGKEYLAESFTVVHYDSVKDYLLDHFLRQFCGIDSPLARQGIRAGVNASAHPLQLAFLRGINAVDPSISRYLAWEYQDLEGANPKVTSMAQFAISRHVLDRFRERCEAFKRECEAVFPDFPLLDYDLSTSHLALSDTEPDVHRDVFAMGQSLAHSLRSGYLHRREEERIARHASAGDRT